jgi:hypothetical protein
MERRLVLAGLAAILVAPAARADGLLDSITSGDTGSLTDSLGGLTGNSGSLGAGLDTGEIVEGLKEALGIGTERAVGTVGVLDGFNADPAIHIPLPDSLSKVQSALKTVGMAGMADELELKLNRAAEEASSQATDIFWASIENMSIEDAKGILNGPDDAATQYLRRTTGGQLKDSMRPVVDSSLSEVGAIQSYDAMMGEYESIPFMPDAKADITDYALDKTMDGLFYYVAQEEAAIRNNPVERSTELLKKVFG